MTETRRNSREADTVYVLLTFNSGTSVSASNFDGFPYESVLSVGLAASTVTGTMTCLASI